MEVLKLAGGAALSGFRLDKLNQRIAAVDAGTSVHSAQFWHFVEVTREPDGRERDVLGRLLTYGPPAPSAGGWSAEVLVAPRLGTISPWSSKATDIARLCNSTSCGASSAGRSSTSAARSAIASCRSSTTA